MKPRRLAVFVIVLTCLVASAVLARSIFLNGKRIDGITDQKFEKVTVTIDAHGDVFIDAPGYLVQGSESGESKPVDTSTTSTTGIPGKRYWLIKDENQPGRAQYDVDIYINSVWYKRIRSNGEQIGKEITSKLRAGPNVIHFAATKKIDKERKSHSPQDFMRIIIGEGNIGGNNVMIENPLVKYRRTAYETANFNDEFTIIVK